MPSRELCASRYCMFRFFFFLCHFIRLLAWSFAVIVAGDTELISLSLSFLHTLLFVVSLSRRCCRLVLQSENHRLDCSCSNFTFFLFSDFVNFLFSISLWSERREESRRKKAILYVCFWSFLILFSRSSFLLMYGLFFSRKSALSNSGRRSSTPSSQVSSRMKRISVIISISCSVCFHSSLVWRSRCDIENW